MTIYFTICYNDEAAHLGACVERIGCSMEIPNENLPNEVKQLLDHREHCKRKNVSTLTTLSLAYGE